MVIIIDNNLLLDLIFGFVQEKRRKSLVNIRKNLVYVWTILFETVFGVIFSVKARGIPVLYLFEPVLSMCRSDVTSPV